MSTDMIDLHGAQVFDSPADIADWPITRTITAVTFGEGVSFTFDQPLGETWKFHPNPAAPADNFQYTVWPVVNVNGKWLTAGIIQMWDGRGFTGAPILHDWNNWVYARDRWGAMLDYQPKFGDTIGFFVTAGNARGQRGTTSVRERSNVVTLPLVVNGTTSLATAPPSPAPVPAPPSAPPPDTADEGAAIVTAILARLDHIVTRQAAIELKLDALAIKPAPPAPTYSGLVFGAKVVLKPST